MEKSPKIGFALSGAGVRSLYYIGLLEVLTEKKVPIHFISACSSSSIIAAAYACGNLDKLKQILIDLDLTSFYKTMLSEADSGGLYSLDKMEEVIRSLTDGKKFEEVAPQLSFMAVDIKNGEVVALGLGDIARASRISCTVPGLFDPVPWGNKLLVDGGILSVVPVEEARLAGCDIVCGVHIRGTKRIFNSKQILAHKILRVLKQTFLLNHAKSLWDKLISSLVHNEWWGLLDVGSDDRAVDYSATTLSVLGRSLDIVIKAEATEAFRKEPEPDYLITLDTKKFSVWQFDKSAELYRLGREAGELHAPKILELIKNHS